LEASDSYRVLRKVPEIKKAKVEPSDQLRYAMIVDTETTGLDLKADEVIELGFVLVGYHSENLNHIAALGNEIREPGRRIPEEVQRLTGITPEMVRGKRLSARKVLGALSLANIVIAHNAAFDRPMCERLLPEFSEKPWACSLTEIPWARYGFESAKLKHLLFDSGYFFDGHRALDDCAALKCLLELRSPSGSTFFSELIERAREPSYLFRVQAPYELRQRMRELGYRWSRFETRTGGVWKKAVFHEAFNTEREIISGLKRDGATFDYIEQDAFNRYRPTPSSRR
tara:strand:- start:1256 stop:2110 length:855 start_codon:yes stop_codon:yes gene_type:complete